MTRYDKTIFMGGVLEKKSQCYSVYSSFGISPTISSGQKRYGGLAPYVNRYDEV